MTQGRHLIVGDHIGCLFAQCWCVKTVSGCPVFYVKQSTSRALFSVCSRHVSIKLHSDSPGSLEWQAEEVCSVNGTRVQFLCCCKKHNKTVRISKVQDLEHVEVRQLQNHRHTFGRLLLSTISQNGDRQHFDICASHNSLTENEHPVPFLHPLWQT